MYKKKKLHREKWTEPSLRETFGLMTTNSPVPHFLNRNLQPSEVQESTTSPYGLVLMSQQSMKSKGTGL